MACAERAMSRWRSSSGAAGSRAGPSRLVERVAPQAPARRHAVLHLVVGALARGVAEVAQVELEAAVVLRAARSAASCRRSAARRRARGPSPCTRRRSAGSRGTASSPGRRCRANAGSRRGRRPRCVPPSPTPQAAREKSPKPSTETATALSKGDTGRPRRDGRGGARRRAPVPRNSCAGQRALEVAGDVGALAALAQAVAARSPG